MKNLPFISETSNQFLGNLMVIIVCKVHFTMRGVSPLFEGDHVQNGLLIALQLALNFIS